MFGLDGFLRILFEQRLLENDLMIACSTFSLPTLVCADGAVRNDDSLRRALNLDDVNDSIQVALYLPHLSPPMALPPKSYEINRHHIHHLLPPQPAPLLHQLIIIVLMLTI